MNSIGTFLVRTLRSELLTVLLCVGFAAASNPCPVGQYLDRSSSCVECTACLFPNHIILRPCDANQDTVCGSTTEAEKSARKAHAQSKKKNGKKIAATESESTLFETNSSYDIMLEGPKNKSKNTFATMIPKDGEMKRHSSNSSKSSPSKWLDKNGKHIKKDLSSVDENQTSKPSDIFMNSFQKKYPLKPKEIVNEPLDDGKWRPIIRADPVNHQITVDVDPTPMRQAFLPNFEQHLVKVPIPDLHQLLDRKLQIGSDDDKDYLNSKTPDDLDYDPNEEEDDYFDHDVDDDDDSGAPVSMDEIKTSEKPFGVEDNPLKNANDIVGDDSREVFTEPYIDTSNWQLLVLVSAVSACFLFVVVVNAYLCIYIKRWRHMKQDFEAGVEDLSVRINLMQHAGFDADESNNIKNYITQLKGGKSSEKVPTSTL